MKKDIHPQYREVLFKDSASDFSFVAYSAVASKEKTNYKGKEYPLYKMEISSASHPFYTNTDRILDTEGRVEKFRKKFGLQARTP